MISYRSLLYIATAMYDDLEFVLIQNSKIQEKTKALVLLNKWNTFVVFETG